MRADKTIAGRRRLLTLTSAVAAGCKKRPSCIEAAEETTMQPPIVDAGRRCCKCADFAQKHRWLPYAIYVKQFVSFARSWARAMRIWICDPKAACSRSCSCSCQPVGRLARAVCDCSWHLNARLAPKQPSANDDCLGRRSAGCRRAIAAPPPPPESLAILAARRVCASSVRDADIVLGRPD